MKPVKVGLVGLGNVGSGTLSILVNNAASIAQKLGFPLEVAAICSRNLSDKSIPEGLGGALRTTDWREVVNHPEVEIVAELVGGTGVARELIEASLAAGKSVVTANKELLALHGGALWKRASDYGSNLAMEASVAGGIPIHTVLREGIAGDRVEALFGILNGTSNYILTEIEQKGSSFDDVLKEAQRLGYAEADPAADVDGYDARSKLAILAALAFGESIAPTDIYTEGIRRVTPMDFDYAHTLKHTIRLIGSARRVKSGGLAMSVRPTLLAQDAIMASVNGAYNAIWVRGEYGQDTFYYGRGAGPHPTGVAVVSDLMRIARELRAGSPQRVSPFAHAQLEQERPVSRDKIEHAFYLRFQVKDQTGIISSLAGILAEHGISIDAVLQLPGESKANLPFVITVEAAPEGAMTAALDRMKILPFMIEPPVAMPMEKGV